MYTNNKIATVSQLALCFLFTRHTSSQTWSDRHNQINGDVLVMLSSYNSHSTLKQIIATASYLQCKLYLINKFSWAYSHVCSYTHSSQLRICVQLHTIPSFLHSMPQQAWSIRYDQITVGVLGWHYTYDIHILNNYACEQLHTREFTREQHPCTQHTNFTLQLSCTVLFGGEYSFNRSCVHSLWCWYFQNN